MFWPTLLTATIVPDARAISKLNDPRERVAQYQVSLRWMARSGWGDVVFCENSAADLSVFDSHRRRFEDQGRRLILVNTPRVETPSFKGKGWGEANIIDWALRNVDALSTATCFLKITGRYCVLNLRRLNEHLGRAITTNKQVEFVSYQPSNRSPLSVETSIFWSRRTFFVEHLTNLADEVDDESGRYLEHALASRLSGLARQHQIGIMPLEPIVWGRKGGNGDYVTRRALLARNILGQLLPVKSRMEFWPSQE